MTTVNQLSYAMTLFCDLLLINWFVATYVCDQALFRPVLSKQPNDNNWFAAKNICNNEALANLVIILTRK